MATRVSISLDYECSYRASLSPPVDIGQGPYGSRSFFEVTGGDLTGERLNGKLLTGGGDWALIGPDGWGRLDVRAQIETLDGARILLTYPAAQRRTPAGPVFSRWDRVRGSLLSNDAAL